MPYLCVPQVLSIPGFVFPSSTISSTIHHQRPPALRTSLGVDLITVSDNTDGAAGKPSAPTGVAIYLRRSFRALSCNDARHRRSVNSDGILDAREHHTTSPATAPHRGFNNVNSTSHSSGSERAERTTTTRKRSVAFSTDDSRAATFRSDSCDFSNDTHKVDVPPAVINNTTTPSSSLLPAVNGYRGGGGGEGSSILSGLLLPIVPLSHEEVVQAITANTGSVAHHQMKDRTAISARAEEIHSKSHDTHLKGLSTTSFESLGRSGGGHNVPDSLSGDSPKMTSSPRGAGAAAVPVKRGQRRFSLIRTANANGWMGGMDTQCGGGGGELGLPPARSPRSVTLLDNSSPDRKSVV